jgi:hypothetical protein
MSAQFNKEFLEDNVRYKCMFCICSMVESLHNQYSKLGIGIEESDPVIGIPESVVSVKLRAEKRQTALPRSGIGLVTVSLFFFTPVSG